MAILTKEEAITKALEYYPDCWTWNTGGQWSRLCISTPDVYFIEDINDLAVVVHHTKKNHALADILMVIRKNEKEISREVIAIPGNPAIEGVSWGISAGGALWMDIKLKNIVIWDDNILKEEE